ncbi:MAG: hemerythrin domain-containing protein [Tannerella sp.]|jgi:regulator of cell morphogenesis and NO signaling|nr:hemerythrin domain-containing protein [Tannerella sp.]
MYQLGGYKETDRMCDLICDNYPMLLVMSRFGIALGFGDQTIGEVCKNSHVDIKTFLAVVNFLIDEDEKEVSDTSLSVTSLIAYLKNSHVYFLNFKLPAIREKLLQAIDGEHHDVAEVVIRYFDEYAGEVRRHMNYEDEIVFPYVAKLLNDEKQAYSIDTFSKQHDDVESRLSELKNIIIKYYPGTSSHELNNVLFDIFSCASDLAYHNAVEDSIFVPVIKALEQQKAS